jgi:hypothetical protein
MKVREYSKTQTGALASLSASSVAAQQKKKTHVHHQQKKQHS